MTETDSRTLAITELVSAARSVISLETSIVKGSMSIAYFLYKLEDEPDLYFPIFDEFMSKTQGLPVGLERLNWEQNALADKDDILAKISEDYRKELFVACQSIIRKYKHI